MAAGDINVDPTFMWPPPNKNELPSPEEIICVKEAIVTLEAALRDAFELVESTKLHIAEMTKDLEERKGWIAPIRKVPTEIMVDIFLRTGEMDNLAPVSFTAVSRLWRNIILATPKAWSFIDFERHYEWHIRLKRVSGYHGYFSGYKKDVSRTKQTETPASKFAENGGIPSQARKFDH
jgi:hypothetical protein